MLTLRTNIRLTQTELANHLGVSRRAISEWESGNQYPSANHLKDFIVLAFKHRAFHAGHETEEIQQLWQASNQKSLLTESWLADLVSSTGSRARESVSHLVENNPAYARRTDWGNAPDTPHFYGREWELSQLVQWVVRCQVVGIVGLGGIGKSTLSIRLMHQVAESFDIVVWRSLRDAPSCQNLIEDCLRVFTTEMTGQSSRDLDQGLQYFLEHLRHKRVLVVLDNLESVLGEDEESDQMRPGYEGYKKLLRRVAETKHQSCLLFTSREKPVDLAALEGSHSTVSILRLPRLESMPCEQLIAEKGVVGSASDQAQLIDLYVGNPLALKIVAQTIVDLFDGEIGPFLEQGEVIYGGVRKLLDDQFTRLSALEKGVLMWLAILREPSSLDELGVVFFKPLPRPALMEALESLYRRSLIERGPLRGSFELQSMILEYTTARIIDEFSDEIQRRQPAQLIAFELELAHVSDYVRQTQTRLLTMPLLIQLQSTLQKSASVEAHISTILESLRKTPIDTQGYGPANLVALLRAQRGDLRGLDLSHLALRDVDLQGVEMQDTTLVGATLYDCNFNETFDSIESVALNQDGKYWAASSQTGQVRVWEATGNKLIPIWHSSTDAIHRFAISPDGRTLACGKWDGKVVVWDIASDSILWQINWLGEISILYNIDFSPDGSLLTVTWADANVRLLDARSGAQLQSLPHPQWVFGIGWRPDGLMIATGDLEGKIRLWNINQFEDPVCVQEILAHQHWVCGLAFSPDGHTLASASTDGTVAFWDVETGQLIQRFEAHQGGALRVKWSADGNTLASAGRDSIIHLWDAQERRHRLALRGHTGLVRGLAFTSNGHQLVSGSLDGRLCVWDVATGKCIWMKKGYIASLASVDWSPDGQQLASGGTDALVIVHSLKGEKLRILRGHNDVVLAVAWSPDGRWLVSSERGNAIRLWDTNSWECVRVIRHPDNENNQFCLMAWSPDSQRIAIGSARHGIILWSLRSESLYWSEHPFATIVDGGIVWSHDGKWIAGGGSNGVLYIWNADGERIQELAGHDNAVVGIDWHSDSKRILSAAGSELVVWDIDSGARLYTITESSPAFIHAVWAVDQGIVVSGGSDGILRWWDIETEKCLLTRDAHEGSIQSFRKNANGTVLASCGDDGAIMLWDLRSGEYLQTLRRDRPYERLNIAGIRGLTDAQKANLRTLGAIER